MFTIKPYDNASQWLAVANFLALEKLADGARAVRAVAAAASAYRPDGNHGDIFTTGRTV